MDSRKFRASQAINYLIYRGVATSQKEIGDLIGYGESYFSQVINGKKALSTSVLEKIAGLSKEINLSWLLTGEGEMLRVVGDRNITQTANGNNHQQVGQSTSATEDQLKEQNKHLQAQLKELQNQLKELQDQNAKLINIITQLTAK